MRRYLLLIAVGIFFGISVSARADQGPVYRFSFPTLRVLPGERISKFELHFRSAMVVGFRTIPVGWRINIDNDPSWLTEVSGIAVVGAANLEPSALRPWFLSLLIEPRARSARSKLIKINGSITLSNRDRIRVIEITDREVALTRQVGAPNRPPTNPISAMGRHIEGRMATFTITRAGLIAARYREGAPETRHYLDTAEQSGFSSARANLNREDLRVETRLRRFADAPYE